MAKITGKKVAGWIGMTLGVVAGVGIGGLFVNGQFLGVPILEWLPQIVHSVVGWVMIGGSVLSGILALFSKR